MSVLAKLHDRVDIHAAGNIGGPPGPIVHAGVRAHVYNTVSETPFEQGAPYRMIETMRVMLPADVEIDRVEHWCVWRGKSYTFDSDPMWRRRKGRDHHQTLNLKRVEG